MADGCTTGGGASVGVVETVGVAVSGVVVVVAELPATRTVWGLLGGEAMHATCFVRHDGALIPLRRYATS